MFVIRFVLGLGGALAVVFMSAIVAKVFEGRELQVVNGVNSVAFNTGLAVALTATARTNLSDPVLGRVTISANPALPVTGSVATAFIVLTGSYFVMKHVFYAQGVVSVIIELVGGGVFLLVLLRKGRL